METSTSSCKVLFEAAPPPQTEPPPTLRFVFVAVDCWHETPSGGSQTFWHNLRDALSESFASTTGWSYSVSCPKDRDEEAAAVDAIVNAHTEDELKRTIIVAGTYNPRTSCFATSSARTCRGVVGTWWIDPSEASSFCSWTVSGSRSTTYLLGSSTSIE